jgi:TonB family protein
MNLEMRILFTIILLLSAALCGAVAGPQSTEETTQQGIDAFRQGDNPKAIKILKAAVKRNRDDSEGWYYLALAYDKTGEFGNARPALEEVVRLRPELAEAHRRLSFALILAGQTELAVAEARRAIDLGDNNIEPHYVIAEASLRAGDAEKALAEANQALRVQNYALALVTKSLALASLKRYGEAATTLSSVVLANAGDPDTEIWQEQIDRWRGWANSSISAATPTTPAETKPMAEVFTGRDVSQKLRVLDKPEPTYSEAARRAGVEGTVIIRAVFGYDGQVRSINVVRTLPYGLLANAIGAARKIRFTPAMKDGRPVSMWLELQYNFNLY